MQMRQEAMGHWEKLFAYFREGRYAAYSLIQVAGEERSGNARLIMRNLELATKTALALYASKDQEEAREIMGTAAELENTLSEKLLNGLDGMAEDTVLRKECSKNIIEYYLARCTLAVVRKCHETGCALLARISESPQQANTEQDGENALAAVKWFRHGVQLVESKEGNAEVRKSLVQLKTPLLEGLARASILSADKDKDALDRAQTITDDLLKSTNLTENRDKVQAFLMINLNIMRRKKAPSLEIAKSKENHLSHSNHSYRYRAALEKSIDVIDWQDEDSINKVLAEVEHPPIHPKEAIDSLSTSSSKPLLKMRKTAEENTTLLRGSGASQGLGWYVARTPVHNATDASLAVSAVDDFRLESAPAIAAATMIWKTADKLSQANGAKSHAAEWFLAGAHSVLDQSSETRSRDKWRRRAAMCFLMVNDNAKAEEQLWSCDPEDADTLYLQFCLASAIGQVDQACDAVKKLGKASSCTEKHLNLAMQAAADSGEDSVMKATMRALLAFKPKDPRQSSDDVALIRALVRMYLKDVSGKSVPKQAVSSVLGLYRQALEICQDVEQRGQLSVYSKDTAWLYKTAYNLGIEGISMWDDTDLIIECFSVAVSLMKVYRKLPGISLDPIMQKQMVRGIHASLCGSVFAARAAESEGEREALWQKAQGQLAELKEALEGPHSAQGKDCAAFRVHAYILEVEILGKHRQWDEIQTLLQNIRPETLPIQACEAIADFSFWGGVPVKVTYALQSLALQIAMKTNDDVFSILRWSRSMIELLIHRKDPGDLPDALAQVQVTRKVVEGHKAEVHGSDELEWLLTTTWNQGLEILSLSDPIGQAKSWLETAISFCSLVANGETRLSHMRKVYKNRRSLSAAPRTSASHLARWLIAPETFAQPPLLSYNDNAPEEPEPRFPVPLDDNKGKGSFSWSSLYSRRKDGKSDSPKSPLKSPLKNLAGFLAGRPKAPDRTRSRRPSLSSSVFSRRSGRDDRDDKLEEILNRLKMLQPLIDEKDGSKRRGTPSISSQRSRKSRFNDDEEDGDDESDEPVAGSRTRPSLRRRGKSPTSSRYSRQDSLGTVAEDAFRAAALDWHTKGDDKNSGIKEHLKSSIKAGAKEGGKSSLRQVKQSFSGGSPRPTSIASANSEDDMPVKPNPITSQLSDLRSVGMEGLAAMLEGKRKEESKRPIKAGAASKDGDAHKRFKKEYLNMPDDSPRIDEDLLDDLLPPADGYDLGPHTETLPSKIRKGRERLDSRKPDDKSEARMRPLHYDPSLPSVQSFAWPDADEIAEHAQEGKKIRKSASRSDKSNQERASSIRAGPSSKSRGGKDMDELMKQMMRPSGAGGIEDLLGKATPKAVKSASLGKGKDTDMNELMQQMMRGGIPGHRSKSTRDEAGSAKIVELSDSDEEDEPDMRDLMRTMRSAGNPKHRGLLDEEEPGFSKSDLLPGQERGRTRHG
ncbi:hypothetical protein QFC20_003575 [Naganishia adeliensis]|uniref:Uncharacterized protein n=1 Tax=Naganishia adeliensis TaxID=92952 RepID=A0ACC2WAW9_9TREE|nr:hypothetical protein QFC20_003575 [Naganishia adeliensis]